MLMRCVKSLNNPAIHVGGTYEVKSNAFGYYVKYPGGMHVMPEDVFKACFKQSSETNEKK